MEVYQEGDGRWRWVFRDGAVDLKSNRTYGDEHSARLAARTAYPGHFHTSAAVSPGDSSGWVGKIAKLLTFALVVTVWRRRRSQSS